jgi:hypothetical protein
MPLQHETPLLSRMDGVLGIVQDGTRSSYLFPVFRRYTYRGRLYHHAAYTSATAPSNLIRGEKLRHRHSSSLPVERTGIIKSRPSISDLREPPEARAYRSGVGGGYKEIMDGVPALGKSRCDDPHRQSSSASAIQWTSVSVFTHVFSSRGFSCSFLTLD